MKKLIFLLIALLLCVSCQQPSDNTPPVKTGIELKSGTRYCVGKGSSETSPAILVKYSDGSRVEAVGSFDSSKSGFADVKQRLKKYEASKATLWCLTEQWFPHMSPISQI